MSNTVQYDSPIASIKVDRKGIFIFKLKDTFSAYDEKEAKRQFDFLKRHSKGNPYKVFANATESANLPSEKAVVYFGKQNKPEYKFAIFANQLPVKVFVGQLLKHNKYNNVKLFKSRKKATNWLLDI